MSSGRAGGGRCHRPRRAGRRVRPRCHRNRCAPVVCRCAVPTPGRWRRCRCRRGCGPDWLGVTIAPGLRHHTRARANGDPLALGHPKQCPDLAVPAVDGDQRAGIEHECREDANAIGAVVTVDGLASALSKTVLPRSRSGAPGRSGMVRTASARGTGWQEFGRPLTCGRRGRSRGARGGTDPRGIPTGRGCCGAA